MVKILIFRTDRIGDLIINCPSIISIKKYFKNSEITLICSKKNVDFAKKLNLFKNIYTFPIKNIFLKIKLIKLLKKENYDYIFIYDGKERSIILASLLNSKFKVALSQSIKIYYKFFKIKFFMDDSKTSLDQIFKNMLEYCEINTVVKNYDFLSNISDNNFSKKISIKNYIHIHLDEKWFSELYIKSYTSINPLYENFIEFLTTLSKTENVLITTGIEHVNLTNQLRDKFFEKVSDKVFINNKSTNSIYLIYKPSFDDILSLLRNSKVLIACHGAITHASNSFDVKKVDILEKSKIVFYKRFTTYLKDYHPAYRTDFNSLKHEIYRLVQNS